MPPLPPPPTSVTPPGKLVLCCQPYNEMPQIALALEMNKKKIQVHYDVMGVGPVNGRCMSNLEFRKKLT